jgi:hypothetical protein
MFLFGYSSPTGCTGPSLTTPTVLSSPVAYRRLWAVAPFANESGVSTVDPYQIADAFTQQLEEVRGIDTVAVNRVVSAMRSIKLRSISTASEAIHLAETLNVDALVVGTITAFDPYPPPTLGMAVQVFNRSSQPIGSQLDPNALIRAPSAPTVSMGAVGASRAVAQASGVYDARNHTTLGLLRKYAAGRTVPDSAFGTESYLMDIELYTQFVSYWLIHDLLAFERSRQRPVEIDSER